MCKSNYTRMLLCALLAFCLTSGIAACVQSTPDIVPDLKPSHVTPDIDGQRGQHDMGPRYAMPPQQINAYRCYQLNNCRSDYTPGVASAKSCVELGGNSWTDKDGTCFSNIGE